MQDFSQNIWPGGALWECGVLLGRLLQDPLLFPQEEWGTMSVVEVGCGPGLTGLVAAVLGARVVLTDKPQVVDQIAQPNVMHNADLHKGRACAAPLWWGEDVSPILAALRPPGCATGKHAGSKQRGGEAAGGSGSRKASSGPAGGEEKVSEKTDTPASV